MARLWPRPGGYAYVPQPEPVTADGNSESERRDQAGTRGQTHGLVINIHWTTVRQSLSDEEICNGSAAQIMTAFIRRLGDVFGADILGRIEGFRIGQKRLISTDPSSDFVNPNTGKFFGHKLLHEGSSYFVFTNLDNPARVRELKRLVGFLGLPAEFCNIRLVDDPGA